MRERERERERNFKKLAHTICRLASPKSAEWAGREEPVLKFKCHGGLFRPSSDYMRPIYVMQSNLLFSKSIAFNVNLNQKTGTSRMFDPISEHCVPVMLTHETNHH